MSKSHRLTRLQHMEWITKLYDNNIVHDNNDKNYYLIA